MPDRTKQPGSTHIGRIIEGLLQKYRRESDQDLLQIWHLWDEVVGAPIARNAKPAAYKGKLLLVHVTNSVWIHQLQFLKNDIVHQLNAAAGQTLVEEIKFKIGAV
ncbi:MAG: DUF721 domain-containing protein [Desulfobacterales bacterium]|nr:MAG: DUF721 domain-containing protein [Desulfobacterales bacterium]